MKSIPRFVLLSLISFIAVTSYGQRISGGINLADLPFQIYGGNIRIEPTNNFYIEGYGSYRPLRERDAVFGVYNRKGTVVDFSLGYQYGWDNKDSRFVLSIGPYLQRKKFTGQEGCAGFQLFGCGELLPERIDVSVVGLRAGASFTLNNGLYISTYGGLGLANAQSEDQIDRVRREQQISIEHEEAYLHARLVLGWEFDLRKKGG